MRLRDLRSLSLSLREGMKVAGLLNYMPFFLDCGLLITIMICMSAELNTMLIMMSICHLNCCGLPLPGQQLVTTAVIFLDFILKLEDVIREIFDLSLSLSCGVQGRVGGITDNYVVIIFS